MNVASVSGKNTRTARSDTCERKVDVLVELHGHLLQQAKAYQHICH